jgi:hypothetical protein
VAGKSLTMGVSLQGGVDNLTFMPEKEVYWPIFEAVKNSFDSIEEGKVGFFRGRPAFNLKSRCLCS